MICCTALAALFGIVALPFTQARRSPLAWRPHAAERTPRRHSLARSFSCALAGVRQLVREERNARIHLVGAASSIAIGLALRITLADWRWIVLAIGLVLAAEALNTAVERVCDLASPGFHPLVKAAKDISAGAVLVLAASALLIGAATFAPYAMGALPATSADCRHG